MQLQKNLLSYRKEKFNLEFTELSAHCQNPLKNEINIKPLRVWSDDSIYGAIILGLYPNYSYR